MTNRFVKFWSAKIDWRKYLCQEGEQSPRDKYDEADREAVKNLSPEDRTERSKIIDKICRIGEVYKRYGEGVENYQMRDELLSEIRGQ